MDKNERFIAIMEKNGYRPETLLFLRTIAGEEMDRGMFITRYREAVKTRCSPSRGSHLFDYLVTCGFIRSNER